MSHGVLTKRRKLAFLCALVLSTPAVHAAVPDGQWKGVVRSDGGSMSLHLIRKGEKLMVKLDEPGNCSVPAKVLEENGEASEFRFSPSPNGGPFCNRMYPGDIRIISQGATIDVSFDISGSTWSGALKPLPVPQRRS
jgi:hypothetical protein